MYEYTACQISDFFSSKITSNYPDKAAIFSRDDNVIILAYSVSLIVMILLSSFVISPGDYL